MRPESVNNFPILKSAIPFPLSNSAAPFCFDKPDKQCFYETNVYTEMAEKYHMENVLRELLREVLKLQIGL